MMWLRHIPEVRFQPFRVQPPGVPINQRLERKIIERDFLIVEKIATLQ
jgi:hypothetical protein